MLRVSRATARPAIIPSKTMSDLKPTTIRTIATTSTTIAMIAPRLPRAPSGTKIYYRHDSSPARYRMNALCRATYLGPTVSCARTRRISSSDSLAAWLPSIAQSANAASPAVLGVMTSVKWSGAAALDTSSFAFNRPCLSRKSIVPPPRRSCETLLRQGCLASRLCYVGLLDICPQLSL